MSDETLASEAPQNQPAVAPSVRKTMQANRSKDTKPEMIVRASLRERGLTGYRLQWKRAAGRPDVAFPGRRVAIFVNGCFWHRCPYCHLSSPKTNADFWQAKFNRNRERDRSNTATLLSQGWKVIVVWECRLKKKRRQRTMSQVACEVRYGSPSKAGRLVVVGNGRSCRERAIRHIRAASRRHRGGRGRRGGTSHG